MIAQIFHQLRGSIADRQRHRLVACGAHQRQGGIDAQVGTVALRRGGQIDSRLGQRDSPFGPSYLHHRVEGGIGQQQRIGIRQTDIFRGTNHQSSGNKLRVFPTLDHAGEPIEGSIRIRTANALDEGRDDIIVHLAVFIVGQGILLQSLHHHLIGNNDFIRRFGFYG